jgi:microcystin-dependent protein
MDPFVAEIRIFGGNFAPTGWAFCDGQLLPISQNTALFSLLGTTYGGDGRTTFALPNLQDRVPVGFGQAPGLSNRDLGATAGAAAVTLLASAMPAHRHTLLASSTLPTDIGPSPEVTFAQTVTGKIYRDATSAVAMAAETLRPAGGNLPHNNMQPYLVMNYIIALQGIYPPRS